MPRALPLVICLATQKLPEGEAWRLSACEGRVRAGTAAGSGLPRDREAGQALLVRCEGNRICHGEVPRRSVELEVAAGRFWVLNVCARLVETQQGRVRRQQWPSTRPGREGVQQHQCERSEGKPDAVVCHRADAKSWSAILCFALFYDWGGSPGWQLAAGFEGGEEKWAAEIRVLPEVETRLP